MHEHGTKDMTDDLVFDVKQGLRKSGSFLPPRTREDDNTVTIIAATIVEHLKLCGWELARRPPLAPHSTGTWAGDDQDP